jgi:hypothetical protein
MDRTRSSNGFGWNAISHHDILAYEMVSRLELRDWERRAVLTMDRLWLAHINRSPDDPQPAEKPNGRKMSPGLFDALFG